MRRRESVQAHHLPVRSARGPVGFDRFADEALNAAFASVTADASSWRLHASVHPAGHNARAFRFALADDGYVVVLFRLDGIDRLECASASCVPGVGRIVGVYTTTPLGQADRQWGESCFQMALDGFVSRFTEAQRRQEQIRRLPSDG